jgi:hypothetical protein
MAYLSAPPRSPTSSLHPVLIQRSSGTICYHQSLKNKSVGTLKVAIGILGSSSGDASRLRRRQSSHRRRHSVTGLRSPAETQVEMQRESLMQDSEYECSVQVGFWR